MLIRPFVRREAVYSSRIEGTQATLGELLAAEAGAVQERSPEDLRAVGNYVAALEHGLKRLKTLPLSLRLVRELHEKLMTGIRGDQATPGEFRRTQNWIGRPGCTLADADFAHVSIRHVDISAEAFAKAAQSVAENTPRALEAVAKWQAVQLPQATRVEFARRAAALRWDADQPVMKLLSPEKLLTPVRYGDAGAAFVETYNREWRLEKLRYKSPLEARRDYQPTTQIAA